jgi:hypothetical protein
MECKKCGESNAELKKTCSYCGAFLEGHTINNVTGEWGYRDSNGIFYPDKENKTTVSDWVGGLK